MINSTIKDDLTMNRDHYLDLIQGEIKLRAELLKVEDPVFYPDINETFEAGIKYKIGKDIAFRFDTTYEQAIIILEELDIEKWLSI